MIAKRDMWIRGELARSFGRFLVGLGIAIAADDAFWQTLLIVALVVVGLDIATRASRHD